MITLARGRDTVQLTRRLWESLQIVAKHSVYAPGCTVEANDPRHLAAALERFVNGEAADSGDLDLAERDQQQRIWQRLAVEGLIDTAQTRLPLLDRRADG